MTEKLEVEQFFKNSPKLEAHEAVSDKLRSFVENCQAREQHVAIVTSGGTTVPLERRCVRYIDNFSGGGRGASSTEYFLKKGYAVIFVHRRKSLQPFEQRLPSLLDMYTINDSGSVTGK